jgi:hypothetical protein
MIGKLHAIQYDIKDCSKEQTVIVYSASISILIDKKEQIEQPIKAGGDELYRFKFIPLLNEQVRDELYRSFINNKDLLKEKLYWIDFSYKQGLIINLKVFFEKLCIINDKQTFIKKEIESLIKREADDYSYPILQYLINMKRNFNNTNVKGNLEQTLINFQISNTPEEVDNYIKGVDKFNWDVQKEKQIENKTNEEDKWENILNESVFVMIYYRFIEILENFHNEELEKIRLEEETIVKKTEEIKKVFCEDYWDYYKNNIEIELLKRKERNKQYLILEKGEIPKWNVKSEILVAIILLLTKNGYFVKPLTSSKIGHLTIRHAFEKYYDVNLSQSDKPSDHESINLQYYSNTLSFIIPVTKITKK